MAKKVTYLLFAALSMGMLVCGFVSNTWQAAPSWLFRNFNADCECMVVGRLVKSHQDGCLSAGALMGAGYRAEGDDPLSNEGVALQYKAYTKGFALKHYWVYRSEPGFQATTLSVLDRILRVPPAEKLRLFRAGTGVLSAAALTLLFVWISIEWGVAAGLFALGGAVLSHWTTCFGRNLYWQLWAYYVPVLASGYLLLIRHRTGRPGWPAIAVAVGGAMLVKCLFTGFGYVTTVAIMSLTPLVYYAALERWRLRVLLGRGVLLCSAVGAAILVGLGVVLFQIARAGDSWGAALSYVVDSFGRRARGDPLKYGALYQASLEASTISVLTTYANGILFQPAWRTGPAVAVRVWHLCAVFLLASLVALLLARQKDAPAARTSRLQALTLATWFSLLAPLSWLIIFKAHSQIHTHVNHITWFMPFVFLGLALSGCVVVDIATLARKRMARCWRRSTSDST